MDTCCGNNYTTTVNNTPVVLEQVSQGCYVSRYKQSNTKLGRRKVTKKDGCCEKIDLSNIKIDYKWIGGDCVDGVITYTDLQLTSKENNEVIEVPLGITPQGLVLLIPSLTIKRAIELTTTRISVTDAACPAVFCNTEIVEQVTAICPSGFTSTTATITIPTCQFSSSISQQDAQNQAINYLNQIKPDFIADNITCTQNGTFCNELVSGTFLKPNCPINTIPQLVPFSVGAGTLCGYASQIIANLAATNLLNSQLEINAVNATSTIYCLSDIQSLGTGVVSWLAFYGPDLDNPGQTKIIDQGTAINMSPSDLDMFTIGDIVSIKYLNRTSQSSIRTGAITSKEFGAIYIRNMFLDDLLVLQQQAVLGQGLLKTLINNRLYAVGATNPSSLLPF